MTDDEIMSDIQARLQRRLEAEDILFNPEEGLRFGPYPATETDTPGVYEVTVPVTAEEAIAMGLDPSQMLPWADPKRDVLRDISMEIREEGP